MNEKILDQIKSSNRILIVSHLEPNGDSLGSMLALIEGLNKLGKKAAGVVSAKVAENLKFLPGVDNLSTDLKGTRDFIIKIKTNRAKIDSIRYDTTPDEVKIVVTPKDKGFETGDIVFDKGDFQYDSIIVLDTPDVGSLDDVYDENRTLFDKVPVINLDHHQSNENFGTLNAVDHSASSTSEIVYKLITDLGAEISIDSATNLLTGLIVGTNNFNNSRTTANALKIAAELIDKGAKQDNVIKSLYGTKTTPQLKIWGRILARLEDDKDLDLVYSSLSHQDFVDCGAKPSEIKGIVDELISKTEANLIVLLIEREPGVISVRLRSIKDAIALNIATLFRGSGTHHSAGFELENIKLTDATKLVLEKIRSVLKPVVEEIRNIKVPLQESEVSIDSKPRIKAVFDEESDFISEPTPEKRIDADDDLPNA